MPSAPRVHLPAPLPAPVPAQGGCCRHRLLPWKATHASSVDAVSFLGSEAKDSCSRRPASPPLLTAAKACGTAGLD